ncbi:hypothetical protein [Desulfuribacillus alkaliarsenatis]|uniref:Uncharacterized protein n=1 Tax=Desulfuribacillus alkaliarsenatis TaxID=766136 RepID=A0A1E5G5I9_9FIRM|nr:hypothetical protein [Desulfuribacillus alkaliarsenatis]OEF98452.1 hypothetical protein BHF68_01900 [Desulfuribacillus alkaliarsenatis]
MQIVDIIILVTITVVIVIAFKNKSYPSVQHATPPKGGAATKLLEANGYEIVAGKHRVPIDIKASDRNYQSRILIDFIAKKNDNIYVVKIKNKRKQERYSGSFLRDELLKYQLFFRVDGVLYIDLDKEKINEVYFDLSNFQYNRSFLDYFKLPRWLYVVAAIGILIFILR